METKNDTEQEVEYTQTGSGGPDVECGPSSGSLAPRGNPGSSRTFPPCQSPPWQVTFTMDGASVASEWFTDPRAIVTLVSAPKVHVGQPPRQAPERNETGESVTTY